MTALKIFPKVQKKYLILFSVFILSLLLRIWLLDKRWINPDEGAHLMDAVLVLKGKIPAIDFDSRQPFYVYANAAVLKLFGVSYISGRLLPMMCSILVGFMVFFMALMLFDQKVAILSAAIYWMLPLEVINSVIVKTEPLVTLLTCLSFFALILFSRANRKKWLIFAGIFAAMGFYVRQSALIIPLTVFGFLLIHHRGRIRDTALSFGFFFIGYACVFFGALMYYVRFSGFKEFVMSRMSPFGFLASAAEKLFSMVGISTNSASGVASQMPVASHAKYSLYRSYIHQAVKLHLFLLVGLGFSLITFSRRYLSHVGSKAKENLTAYSLLYLWIFSLFIAYTFYFYSSSFYIDYSREFLPPLAIIFSAWMCSSISTLKGSMKFVSYVVVSVAFVLSLFFSTNILSFSYDSVWSPGALKKTSDYLKSHTLPTDSVMSGAVIWELQALRKPFLDISHPLGFEYRISEKEREGLETAIKDNPPEIIILDGYTEKTYFRQIPRLWNVLGSKYNLVSIAEPSKKPVLIYQQKDILGHPSQL